MDGKGPRPKGVAMILHRNGALEIKDHLAPNRYGFDPRFRGFPRMIARRTGLLQ